MFKGSFVALITPFRDGKVDEAAFEKLVEWHIEQGTHGLVPCGTTGESPTLSHDEHRRVIELCVKAAAGRVPVRFSSPFHYYSGSDPIPNGRHLGHVGVLVRISVVLYVLATFAFERRDLGV